jgi:GNAT superfamily N-acetyltransferase
VDVTSLGLRTNLMIVTLAGGQVEDRGEYVVARSPDNPTFWWGNFLALPRPPQPEEVSGWLDTFAAELPTAAHRTFALDSVPEPAGGPATSVLGTATAWQAPWTSAGFTSWSDSVLVAESVREPLHVNTEATYRPLASEADWAQLVELRCANDDDHEPAAYRVFVEASVRGIRRMVADGHGQWWGAFIGGRLLSTMGLFTDGSGVARYQNVDTHPDARRLGLAGTLAYRVGRWGLAELGARQVVIVAEPAGMAIALYRQVGFVDAEPVHQLEKAPPGDAPTPAP